MADGGPTKAEVTALLGRWSAGDDESFHKLLPLVYSELRSIARGYVNREGDRMLQATALVHEAFLRLAKQPPQTWNDRKHFFGVTARLMRQILVDDARQRRAGKRGFGNQVTLTDSVSPISLPRGTDFIMLDLCLNKLEEADQRKALIVELRFFGGLSLEEIAETVNLSLSMVKRELTLAKLWMYRYLQENGQGDSANAGAAG
jgi:RNA polymerase sigma factor (TIGR02999 family)